MASEVNKRMENIGARRLHTIIEKILDEISFTATDRAGDKIIINKDYINKNLDTLVKDTDLSKFILYIYFFSEKYKTSPHHHPQF